MCGKCTWTWEVTLNPGGQDHTTRSAMGQEEADWEGDQGPIPVEWKGWPRP